MALYGRYQRVALTFLLWGFSFVHSSLIDYSCQNWEGYGKFLDVTFGDQPSLSKASCDQDVQLETFSDSPPRVRYSQAVSVKKYLIAMVDPDAPSRESHSCRSWLHWIVGNIKVTTHLLHPRDLVHTDTTCLHLNKSIP